MNKQVTNVSGTAADIVTPGWQDVWVNIQNNGAGAVRITCDGYTIPTATTLGYLLNPNKEITISYGGSNQGKGRGPIKAILVTGTTTTLDIMTPDNNSV